MVFIRKIKLKYHNSFGEVLFQPGFWQLTDAEGLGMPKKQIYAVRYANCPGQSTLSVSENPRTVTLRGDINLDVLGEDAFSKASAVLGNDGILTVESGHFKRQAKARCTELIPGVRSGNFRAFVVQFVCDLPYFEDVDYTEDVVFETVPLLSSETVLPAIFSTRTSKGSIFYAGSVATEPIIEVNVPVGSGTITLENRTTGGKICFNYDAGLFHKLIIDVEMRTITDENGISRLDLLTDDSFFDGFCLDSGDNYFEVIDSSASEEVNARILYKVRYREAIV